MSLRKGKKKIMNNKTYNILKWIVITVLPALSVLIATIGNTLNYSDTNTIVIILNAVTVFLGATIGVSSVKYKEDK